MTVRAVVVAAAVALAACGGGGDTSPTVLEDGKHFGFVTRLDPRRLRLEFDAAELFVGSEARRAAREDGAVVTAGGSYVRDIGGGARTVLLDVEVEVRLLDPCCELHPASFESWLAGFDPADDRTFYGTRRSRYTLTIRDGRVVAVEEVLVP